MIRQSVEADYNNFLGQRVLHAMTADFGEGDLGGSGDGESINSGADRWKSDRMDAVILCQPKTVSVAFCQKPMFVVISTSPDGSHSVDNPACGQIIAPGHFGRAGFASMKLAALFKKFRSRGSMDGSIHASTAQEAVVGRVHDGVNFLKCYIPLDDIHSIFQLVVRHCF